MWDANSGPAESTPAEQKKVEAEVTVEHCHRGQVLRETNASPELGFLPVEGPAAYVTVEVGQTVNTGDYNSVRARVSVTMPTPATDEAVNRTYERGLAWAQRKLHAMLATATASAPPSKGAAPKGHNEFA